jgi:ribosome maturation factor RimP
MSWQAAIDRTVQGMGYDMVDVEKTAGGLLRVFIDRLPGQTYSTGPGDIVTIEDCELVTRQLQFVLEVEAADYARLEVSSPGLDRPLRKPADWDRFVGSDVEVTLRQLFQGRRKWTGRLDRRADGGFRLVLPAQPLSKTQTAKRAKAAAKSGAVEADSQVEQTLDFAFEEVREARLVPVIDFKGRRRESGDAAQEDGGQNR